MPTKKTLTGNATDEQIRDLREWYNKNESRIKSFEEAQQALQLVDYTKSTKRTYTTYDRETLRTYTENPVSNYKNIRKLSQFLYNRSQPYRRLIWYFATMIDLTARSVIPNVDFTQPVDTEAMLKSYYETLNFLEPLNMGTEFLKALIIAWREDLFAGCVYYGEGEGFFILPLDTDYVRIAGAYYTGDFSAAFDMSYFRSNQDLLEILGEPWTSMYSEYERDPVNSKWQLIPDENCLVLKVNLEDYEVPIAPFLGLFEQIINLLDEETNQALASDQKIYKLLAAQIPTLDDATEPNDWAVSPGTAVSYFNRLRDALPAYADAVITPLPLETISFDSDANTDTSTLATATENLFSTSGGAQILNGTQISGTTAFRAAMLSDENYAISSLLPQIEGFLNRWVAYFVTDPARIKLHEVTAYTKQEYKESLLKDAQYGVPVKMLLNTLNGFSELETMSLTYLEEALDLQNRFKPLESSHTQSGSSEDNPDDPLNEGGGQEKPLSELSDDGEASIDKRDNANE